MVGKRIKNRGGCLPIILARISPPASLPLIPCDTFTRTKREKYGLGQSIT